MEPALLAGGGGPDFRRRHRLLPRWSGGPGARMSCPSSPGRRLGLVGDRFDSPSVPFPCVSAGILRAGGREGRRAWNSRVRPGWARGGPPRAPHPSPPCRAHLPGPQEAAPSLNPGLLRVAGGGGGRHGTPVEGPSWGPPECLDAELSVLAFSFFGAQSPARTSRRICARGGARAWSEPEGPALKPIRVSGLGDALGSKLALCSADLGLGGGGIRGMRFPRLCSRRLPAHRRQG